MSPWTSGAHCRLIAGALVCAAVVGPAASAPAATLTWLDLVNPPSYVYQVSDIVTVGVFVDGSDVGPLVEMLLHESSTAEVSLASLTPLPILGWLPLASVGGTCDLVDPYGPCVAAMYEPTGTGSLLIGQQIATLSYEVVAVGSGQAVLGGSLAPTDAILAPGNLDVTASFVLQPAIVQIVPEPGTLALVGFGLLALAAARRLD